MGENEANCDEFEVPTVPRENVKFPPPEGYDGVQHPIECVNPECDFFGDMGVEFGKDAVLIKLEIEKLLLPLLEPSPKLLLLRVVVLHFINSSQDVIRLKGVLECGA